MTLSEQLMHNTVRIEGLKNGQTVSMGTGFIFDFHSDADAAKGATRPAIVTNKHVVENFTDFRFYLTLRNGDGSPDYSMKYQVNLSDVRWIEHPNKQIDLSVLPLAFILKEIAAEKSEIYYKRITKEHLPSEELLQELSAIEPVTLFGYPCGLWDEVNNLPIFRRGITATHPKFDFNGNRKFLIDAAIYPGSSGSPVYLLSEGSYLVKGETHLGSRVTLLGVVHATYQHTVNGDIQVVDIPTTKVPMSITPIPNNLGIVIKSSELLAFEPYFVD